MELKELKTLIKDFNKKGYILNNTSIIEDNLKNHITNTIKEFNVLNVENPKIDLYKKVKIDLKKKFPKMTEKELLRDFKKLFYEDTKLKDFKELKKEIEIYFKGINPKDRINELLKELHLNSKNMDYFSLKDKPFKEIKNILEDKLKKEIDLKVYYSAYGGKSHDLISFISKINELLKLLLNVNEDLKSLDYDYNEDLKSLENKINTSLKSYKIRCFLNGKITLKFKDIKNHNEIKNLFIEDFLKRCRKDFYINFVDLKNDYIKNKDLIIYKTEDNQIYLNFELNYFEYFKYKDKYALIKHDSEVLNNRNCLAHLQKGDKERYKYRNEEIQNNLNKEQGLKVLKYIDNYFKD